MTSVRPRVPPSVLRRIVDVARLAPSIHNTQPWAWRARDGSLELRADRTRALPATDPRGRHLVISCGTALHHAVVAAAAMGLEPDVNLCPDSHDPDLLARVTFAPGHAQRGRDLLRAVSERHTDRRRFTSWPIPAQRIDRLAAEAASWGAEAISVNDESMRRRFELMLERARVVGSLDAAQAAETAEWLGRRSDYDGIPLATVPPVGSRPGEHPNRFEPPDVGRGPDLELVASDGLLVVATTTDDPTDWLCAGLALSAVWLRATIDGISVVPLSQVVEYRATRELLRTELSIGRAEPQILVRLGWQEIGRSSLPRTPRRTLDDVLLVTDDALAEVSAG